ncbi:hypothetical protein GCM10022286_17950 [Gryllotalpicola daejeonensis]|uniref:Uncharacterized protein n=1 Tax=Gryllotalpicola daejeonensis TaxID=993087 RepID=A0ABP7ZK22_9MICO
MTAMYIMKKPTTYITSTPVPAPAFCTRRARIEEAPAADVWSSCKFIPGLLCPAAHSGRIG